MWMRFKRFDLVNSKIVNQNQMPGHLMEIERSKSKLMKINFLSLLHIALSAAVTGPIERLIHLMDFQSDGTSRSAECSANTSGSFECSPAIRWMLFVWIFTATKPPHSQSGFSGSITHRIVKLNLNFSIFNLSFV